MIHQGDALEVLKTFEPESIDCCITSPPYWALRDYKVEGQLGLEPTFSEYVDKLVAIFDQVKRVLKRSGACWVVLGDTYGRGDRTTNCKQTVERNENRHLAVNNKTGYSKSLCMIPERFALKMIDHGWILRNKIIWYKPNCMPSSAKDRFTVDFENVFFFTKSQRYYFETQYEPALDPEDDVRRFGKAKIYNKKPRYFGEHQYHNKKTDEEIRQQAMLGRIKRTVWTINTRPFKGSHFAVFPEELVETPLRATCPVDGTVLDPFMGSGTTGLVALKLARRFVGIELNKDYIKLAEERLRPWTEQTKLQ